MKHKNKNIIKCIMTIVLTVAMVLGAVPVEGLVLPAHAAAEETKEFSNSNITAGSTNQLNYEGNLFISATGDATASKANNNPYHITLRSPYQQEGTLRLYPRISGKVKSIVFSSAYMFADEGYMKIGKGSTWTNSISEKNEGNNPWKSFEFTCADGIQLDNESDYLEIKLFHATKNGSFFSKGSITITYEPTASTLTHTHSFSYSKNGSTLTATCAHNDGMECSLASDNWQISTTLTPPTFRAYAQYRYHPATLSNIAGFTTETGATAGDITYVNNTTGESLGTSMPHDIGAYTASVTIATGGTDYTLTTSYSVGSFCGINTNYPQFTTDKEGNYAIDGETVTLTFTPQFGETLTGVTVTGVTSGNDITLTSTGANTYLFTMPQEEVNIGATFSEPDASNFDQTGENEYTIKTANGWNWFCFAVNYDLAPDGFSGKTVKLAANIESSEMAGKSGHSFKGTFDGQGNTLTFNLQASEGYSAPFHYTDDATISNLNVTGLIEGNDISPLAGLVGKATGNLTIENCHVSTQISTTVSISAWHGGIIAFWDDSNVECTITGCVYDGLIYNPNEANTTSYCFGFLGNSYGSNMDITFTDCLFAPAEYTNDKKALREDYGSRTFVYPKSGLIFHVTNCYYTTALGKRQGRPAATVTTAPANLGAETTNHGIVKGYENGILYNGNYYTPKYGDVVVEYHFDDDEEHAKVTINGEGNNLVGVNITENVEKVSSVNYNRTFTPGVATTVILPFDYTCSENADNEGGKFYEFTGIDDYLEPIIGNQWNSSLSANTPYVFIPTKTTLSFPNITNMTGGVVTLQSTAGNHEVRSGDWTLTGTYVPKTWAETEPEYGKTLILDNNGKLTYISFDTKVLSTQGYFVTSGNIHTHSFTYTASTDGKSVIATCTDDCQLTDKKATLTINAPLHTTYGDGNTAEARLSGDTTILGTPVITYTGSGNTTYAASTTAPTGAGSYIASITLGSGDTTATASISYTIAKADPSYTAPTGLTATYGQTLSNVSLPEGWTWADDSISVGNVGNNTFKATYTPNDSNYNTVSNIDVTVAVGAKSITGATVTLSATQIEYTGSEQSVSVTGVTLDGVALTTNDYEVTSGTTGTEKNNYTVTITGKGNYKDTATATWAITDKPMTVTAENVSVTYDGSGHGITVTVSDPTSGYTIKYGNTADSCTLDASPMITNVSDSPKTVYFKITAANYADYTGSATITINPKTVKPTAGPETTSDPNTTQNAEPTPELTPVVTKNDDGSTTETTMKENTDGSTTKTETTTGTDGTIAEVETTTKKDGTTTVKETVQEDNGTTTVKETVTKKDGSSQETETVTEKDGTTTVKETVTDKNGSSKSEETTKDKEGNVIQTVTEIAETDKNGSTTVTTTTETAEGTSSVKETVISKDGTSKSKETTKDSDGNVLKTVEETVTVNKKGTVTVQTTTETVEGTKVESTEKTTKAGKVVTETTETKADGSTTYTKETKNTDGSVTVDTISTESNNTTVITKEKVNNDGLKETDVYSVEVASKGSGKKKAGKVELSSITAKSKVEAIPDTIKVDGKTYKVDSIGENALAGNKKVQELSIGKYVTSIGENAFANAKKLKDIQIYGSITEIGEGAFSGIAKKAVITIHADEKTFNEIVKLIKASGVGKKVKFVRAD